jgi:hypothetical protein
MNIVAESYLDCTELHPGLKTLFWNKLLLLRNANKSD